MGHTSASVHRCAGLSSLLGCALVLCALLAAASVHAEDEDWPLSYRLVESFVAGDTARVLAQAPDVLRLEPNNLALREAYAKSLLWSGQLYAAASQFRLMLGTEKDAAARLGLANALAWTGDTGAAIPYYTALLGGPLDGLASQGLANAQRWNGRPDLAVTHYVRLMDAKNEETTRRDAAQGLALAQRALRPRTWVGVSQDVDNSPIDRTVAVTGYQWRDTSQTQLFSIALSAARTTDGATDMPSRDWTARAEFTDWMFRPVVSVSERTDASVAHLAHLRLQLGDGTTYLHLGQVNWSHQALTTGALSQGLMARQWGIQSTQATALGRLSVAVDRYEVSDGNTLINGDVRWQSGSGSWRPHVGVAWRDADQARTAYWSPDNFVAGYAGMERNWESAEGTLGVFATVGRVAGAEGAFYWSTALTGTRWLNRDWALRGSVRAQSGVQGAQYRTHAWSVQLDRLW